MALDVGELILGRYRIDGLLGQGGMGAVYRAFDLHLELPCALKQLGLAHLPSGDTTQPEDGTRLRSAGHGAPLTRAKAAEQFRREAHLLARLDHPNLPRVTDCFAVGDDHFLVMSLIEGEDLQEVLERAGGEPLPEAQVLAWLRQVMDALAYCHAQGVVHRDVKPANMILTQEGKVHLVDFGIAKPDDPARKTTVGARAITVEYSPLEQYTGVGHTDARSDVYALGATMYALLSGQAPRSAAERVTGEEMPTPRSLVPAISAEVDAAIARAMAIRPAERFQSISELQAALAGPAAVQGSELGGWLEEIVAARRLGNEGLVAALLDQIVASQAGAASAVPAGQDAAVVVPPVVAAPPEPTTPWPVPRGWRVIRRDFFRDGARDWPTGAYEQPLSVGTISVGGGEYRWQVRALGQFVSRIRRGSPLATFYLAVETRLLSGPVDCHYGLSFRSSADGDYVYWLRGDGCFALRAWCDGAWADLLGWSRALNYRRLGTNSLAVLAQGTRLRLLLNGEVVGEAEDSRLSFGTAGLALALARAGDAATVAFDAFELLAP